MKQVYFIFFLFRCIEYFFKILTVSSKLLLLIQNVPNYVNVNKGN